MVKKNKALRSLSEVSQINTKSMPSQEMSETIDISTSHKLANLDNPSTQQEDH